MTFLSRALCAALVLAAGAAIAQEKEPQNPAVKARVEVMHAVRANTGILGDMASGKAAFDAAKAEAAKAALAAAAADIAPKFEAQETDPASEAKPEIWANFADFTAKAKSLEEAATMVDASSAETLKAGMGAIAGTCKACHSIYRM